MSWLILNAGSSSLKYQVFSNDLRSQAAGLIARIGEPGGDAADHVTALQRVFAELGTARPSGVGHRVVHGGESFASAVLVDDAVLREITRLIPLAPLHNPAAVAGIAAARTLLPGVPQVAVFDTAFHQTIPASAARYALPTWCYERYGIRRYGMHGTSHAAVSRTAAELLGIPLAQLNVISLHLGNGASAAAIAGGVCIETSMGLTPLEGLMMGTRCGDLDPAVPLLLCREAGLTPAEVDRLLNRESGLKGICGENDMRAVLARVTAGDAAAELALAMFCHRIRKYIGAYAVTLGRLDAIAFTAGIGQYSPEVRRRCCERLSILGVELDEARNAECHTTADIATATSRVRILVIPADEEREIARQTQQTVEAHRRAGAVMPPVIYD